jgi:hypothetical protein
MGVDAAARAAGNTAAMREEGNSAVALATAPATARPEAAAGNDRDVVYRGIHTG